MTAPKQLALFAQPGGTYYDGDAPAIYDAPQPCGGCHVVRVIVARAWRPDGWVWKIVDLCVACTASEIETRRARGQHEPPGFGWVR